MTGGDDHGDVRRGAAEPRDAAGDRSGVHGHGSAGEGGGNDRNGVGRRLRLTWANALTLLRAITAPCCAYAILEGHLVTAAWLFALAVATDFADGAIARRHGEASPVGGLFDHATDAWFVTVTLSALGWRDEVPALLPLLVALAFSQYVLDSRAHMGQQLRTSRLGKLNGIAYFVLVGVPVIRDALGWSLPPSSWVLAAGWVLVLTTLVSMIDRLQARVRSAS